MTELLIILTLTQILTNQHPGELIDGGMHVSECGYVRQCLSMKG